MSERMVREDVKLEREEESSFVKPPKYSGKIPQEVLPLISFNFKEVKGSWEQRSARLPAEFYAKKTIEETFATEVSKRGATHDKIEDAMRLLFENCIAGCSRKQKTYWNFKFFYEIVEGYGVEMKNVIEEVSTIMLIIYKRKSS